MSKATKNILFFLMVVVMTSLTACKSEKTATTVHEYNSAETDSTSVQAATTDSARTAFQQQTQTAESDATEIEFTDDGGTVVLDSLGRIISAAKVKNIRMTKQVQQLQQINAAQARKIEQQATMIQELKKHIIMQENATETAKTIEESNAGSKIKAFLWGMVVGVALYILAKLLIRAYFHF